MPERQPQEAAQSVTISVETIALNDIFPILTIHEGLRAIKNFRKEMPYSRQHASIENSKVKWQNYISRSQKTHGRSPNSGKEKGCPG